MLANPKVAPRRGAYLDIATASAACVWIFSLSFSREERVGERRLFINGANIKMHPHPPRLTQ
jgi:hypothetical protein